MFNQSGATAKFLIAISLSILVIQAGSGAVSLIKSKSNGSQQAAWFIEKMRIIQENEKQLLEKELISKEAATASLLAKIAADYIDGFEYSELDDLATNTMKDPQFTFVNFYDSEGTALSEEYKAESSDIKEISHPIFSDGETLGKMVIGLSYAEMNRVYNGARENIDQILAEADQNGRKATLKLAFWTGGISFAGLVLIAGLIVLLLSKIITAPGMNTSCVCPRIIRR